ncbi:MAG: hypothetical protein C5B50_15670 [Verrucomicrobia bacterium]|nr:MAG: hypothetical protein C5B50_15670 [Verrucomicrobiota bacterium]
MICLQRIQGFKESSFWRGGLPPSGGQKLDLTFHHSTLALVSLTTQLIKLRSASKKLMTSWHDPITSSIAFSLFQRFNGLTFLTI